MTQEMTQHVIGSLYVFMLAAFIGFEVIKRVSPLLHTPLMSLTNAAGCHRRSRGDHPGGRARGRAGDGDRHAGDRRRHQQRCRRILDHGPYAWNVQGQRP